MKIPANVLAAICDAPHGGGEKLVRPFAVAARRRHMMGNKTKFRIAARKKRRKAGE